MAYSKPWQSYEEQLDLLLSRGLQVTDRPMALEYLKRIGYYRLSGYWFPFRARSGPLVLLDDRGRKPSRPNKVETIALDSFEPGATFENAVKLYVFDKQLRLLAMDALERIEIALRVDISHTLGKLDRFAYLRPELFHPDFGHKLDKKKGVSGHHEWLSKHAQLISRSKEEFVRHNNTL
jgi:abortive infection bacteriophage resistance protein